MKYTLLMYWLALKWVFRVNLGDQVRYQGKKYYVHNGVRCGMWRLGELENGDNGWVKREECRKVVSLRNFYGSFKSAVWFYRTNWLDIWKRSGIKPWMKGCNIW